MLNNSCNKTNSIYFGFKSIERVKSGTRKATFKLVAYWLDIKVTHFLMSEKKLSVMKCFFCYIDSNTHPKFDNVYGTTKQKLSGMDPGHLVTVWIPWTSFIPQHFVTIPYILHVWGQLAMEERENV